MRQRLSSEPDRYRGRRRVPTPPRSRYAVVVTSAFVGAGVVALGAASHLPDAKAVNPSVLQNLEQAASTGDDLADRAAERATAPPAARTAAPAAKLTDEEAEADAWLLPLDDYRSPRRTASASASCTPASTWPRPRARRTRRCTPVTVTAAGYNGGYGYAITIEHSDGTEIDLRPLAAAAGQGRRHGQGRAGDRPGRQHRATRTARTCTSRSTSTASRPTRSSSCASTASTSSSGIESVYGDLAAS